MVKNGVHRLGYIYDRPAEWVLLPIAQKIFKISFDPSPSRWGFFAVFLACGLFVLSIFFATPLLARSTIMWVFWLGVALIVTAIYIGGYFLRHQDRDPSSNQLKRIEQGIRDLANDKNNTLDIIKNNTEVMKQLLEYLKDKDKRDNGKDAKS
ncbi:hypothetical protein ES703_12255 [subsurface metagenome]